MQQQVKVVEREVGDFSKGEFTTPGNKLNLRFKLLRTARLRGWGMYVFSTQNGELAGFGTQQNYTKASDGTDIVTLEDGYRAVTDSGETFNIRCAGRLLGKMGPAGCPSFDLASDSTITWYKGAQLVTGRDKDSDRMVFVYDAQSGDRQPLMLIRGEGECWSVGSATNTDKNKFFNVTQSFACEDDGHR